MSAPVNTPWPKRKIPQSSRCAEGLSERISTISRAGLAGRAQPDPRVPPVPAAPPQLGLGKEQHPDREVPLPPSPCWVQRTAQGCGYVQWGELQERK